MMAPRGTTSYYPDLMNVTLFEKRVFADVIKDLETRSSRIAWVGLKSNDKCPYKEETQKEAKRRKKQRLE